MDPAVDLYYSLQADGDSTVVMEVNGVDHLDIAKHPFVHALVLEALLPRMGRELGLGADGQGPGQGLGQEQRLGKGQGVSKDRTPSSAPSPPQVPPQVSPPTGTAPTAWPWSWLRSLLPAGPPVFLRKKASPQDVDQELAAFEFLRGSQSRSIADDILVGNRLSGGVPGLGSRGSGRKRAMVRRFLRALRARVFAVKRSIDALLISLIRLQSAET